MKRFLLPAIIVLIMGSVFFMVPEKQAPSQENPFSTLSHIMKVAEASVVEGEFHYWASLRACPQIVSLADLEARADEILNRIIMEGGSGNSTGGAAGEAATAGGLSRAVYHPGMEQDGGLPAYMMVDKERELPSGSRVRLLLQQMEQDGVKVNHLLVTVTQEGDAYRLNTLASRLPAVLKSEVQDSNLSFCLTGHIDGELTPAEMEQLALAITREVGGEGVQTIRDGAMISVTGYTPDFGEYLRAENLRINFNLAMRYDDYLDKTVVWAGTPLIARQY